MLQNPTMCVMWGGSSHFFTARSLRSKIPALEAFVPPTHFPSGSGNLTTGLLSELKMGTVNKTFDLDLGLRKRETNEKENDHRQAF